MAAMVAVAGPLNAQDGFSPLPSDLTKVPADGTVTLEGGLVSAGVGYEWGRGTVTFRGTQHAFCIRGLMVGDVGVANIDARGVIFHMSSIEDFPGKYSSVSLGAAVIKGTSSALLKNKHGVTMQLESRVTGLRFNIAGSGVRISLEGTKGCQEPARRAPHGS